jgi:hypothetical protein
MVESFFVDGPGFQDSHRFVDRKIGRQGRKITDGSGGFGMAERYIENEPERASGAETHVPLWS